MSDAAWPLGRGFWEERYASPGYAWSGRPNPVLVAEAGSLVPGRALDVGSGEGADALWLAQHGWHVTGVAIAANALDKAKIRSSSIDPVAATRIGWERHDLTQWSPDAGTFDLVSAQFMHLPEPARSTLFRSLAMALAPGGTLLIVAHDMSEVDPSSVPESFRGLAYGVDDILGAIKEESLRIEVAEVRPRSGSTQAADSDGHRDVVVRATRLPDAA